MKKIPNHLIKKSTQLLGFILLIVVLPSCDKSKSTDISTNEFMINDELDRNFKPGIFLQTKSFLGLEMDRFQTVNDQLRSMKHYQKIAGY